MISPCKNLEKIEVFKSEKHNIYRTQFLVLITIIILPLLKDVLWGRTEDYMIKLTF
jgi:hypothetical protein